MSNVSLNHIAENISNFQRDRLSRYEPKAQRTFTPSQAVLSKSAGPFHWTPEGRRLFDFTSGVLVANLGHNPVRWTERFFTYMGWPIGGPFPTDGTPGYFPAVTMTAYNGLTPIEAEATQQLIETLQSRPGGARLEQVLWAASGSEAIQKAVWAAWARDRSRSVILATRFGFHGKKGLAGAITGSEHDHERDPRVRFIGFPMHECRDVSQRDTPVDLTPYRRELDALAMQFGRKIAMLVTEPYLGGGGSYHPPKAYLQMLQEFCREHDIVFILDEVQANFGRTGKLFAFETYGLEPDIVVLGKGLGNGVPVAAAVGRRDIFMAMDYGEGSDTWSANPLCCAAVLATLEEFADGSVMANCNHVSKIIESGLVSLKELPFVAYVRGEVSGMVWGLETRDWAGKSASDWANAIVLACYRGIGDRGIHLLGPLAKRVVRVSPPLTITETQAHEAMGLMQAILRTLASLPAPTTLSASMIHGSEMRV